MSDPRVHSLMRDVRRVLVDRHGRMVLGVCRHVLRNQDDAEVVVQAVFLVLALKAAAICKQDAVGCWLHGGGASFHPQGQGGRSPEAVPGGPQCGPDPRGAPGQRKK